MVLQQAGLDVGAQANAGIQIALHEAARIGELVSVPVEDVALRADRRVTRRQVERITQDVVFAASFDELAHLLLRVGRVGVRHGRAGIAQAPLRHPRRAAGHPCKAARGVERRIGRGDEVVVEIAERRRKVAIVAVVVVQLAAHVKAAVGQCVVEQPEAGGVLGVPRHVERDVLVQRVGRACAVAHRVDVAHLVALVGAVELAGALAQAEVHLARFAAHVVVDLLVPVTEVVSLGGAVVQHGLPLACATDLPRAEAPRQRNGQADLAGLQAQRVGIGMQLERRQREPAEVSAIPPSDGRIIAARGDRPRGRATQVTVRQHQHTDDVFFKHEDFNRSASAAGQAKAIAFLRLEFESGGMQHGHRFQLNLKQRVSSGVQHALPVTGHGSG